jgi:exosortase D (VPLPA-CTERM-specific)
MISSTNTESLTWRTSRGIQISFVALGLLLGFIYFDGLRQLVHTWGSREEFSYGYLIPIITLFLLWQKGPAFAEIEFKGSWTGPVILLVGFAIFVIGNLSTLYLVVQYSFVVVLMGLALAYVGTNGFRLAVVPLAYLVFMIPLPQFFLTEISTRLQLMSSEFGVAIIRLFGISVHLEGNVIDLGTYKLQVVEACNGLRYLFPLLVLGFTAGYFFRAPLWKRAVLFLSAMPITVAMNSLRIGIIGVMVEYWGQSMAEGFLHDFEGWAMFMASALILVGEIWLLGRLGNKNARLADLFAIDFPAPRAKDTPSQQRTATNPYIAAVAITVATAVVVTTLPQRTEIIPPRLEFSHFPQQLGEWQGTAGRLEQIYIDALKFDDYILSDYTKENETPVNLYIAYYATQRKGESVHSPRTCIPGGGWEIKSLTRYAVDGVRISSSPLIVNRTVIQMGEQKQLVYYWFLERGRDITNEIAVKWYIFWDALTRNRTDGALIRLTTLVSPHEDVSDADRRLRNFVESFGEKLSAYVPD